ncbi:MAG: hypothetical protein L0Y54_10065 [Sporichthyaceae bacterium]|nr:hypothetical protein [Sporichthyaceae bacterium]
MESSDARIVRGALLVTVPVCAVVTAVAALLDGLDGLYGALFGSLLAIAFFAVTIVAVSVAGRIDPLLMLPAALGTYVVKMGGILVVLLVLRDTEAFDRGAFAVATVIGAVAFMVAEVRFALRARTPYVDTEHGAPPGR